MSTILQVGIVLAFYIFLAVSLRLGNRVTLGIGLLLLVSCPFLLMAQQTTIAPLMAEYAFGFLLIGFLQALAEQLQQLFVEHTKPKRNESRLARWIRKGLRISQ